jgi:hypothetical protein
VAEIAARTRATTGCGTCRDAVEGIVAWLAAADGPGEPSAGPEPARRPEYALLPAGATAGKGN